MKIQPIVEGDGEVAAVPVLLRRLISEAKCFGVTVARPFKRTQSQLCSREGVQTVVQVALLQPECRAVLILFDEEDGCPVTRATEVRGWALEVARGMPCQVVVAHREYETWFLAALESLRGQRGIRDDAVAPAIPESKRDAKGQLESWMPKTRAYSETLDQAAMSELFDLAVAHQRSRSFRKLVSTVGEILKALDCEHGPWPPDGWAPTKSPSS